MLLRRHPRVRISAERSPDRQCNNCARVLLLTVLMLLLMLLPILLALLPMLPLLIDWMALIG